MNFAVFSKFILVLGLVVAGFGAFKYSSNGPVSSKQIPGSNENTLAGLAAATEQRFNEMAAESQNERARFEQKKALKIVGAGGGIIFLAVAIMVSAKKTGRP